MLRYYSTGSSGECSQSELEFSWLIYPSIVSYAATEIPYLSPCKSRTNLSLGRPVF